MLARTSIALTGVMTFATVRKFLFQLHMWIGLVLGLALAALGLSGSLLVYEDELVRLLSPPPRATAQGAPLALDAIIAAVRARSDLRGPATITPSGGAHQPAMVRIGAARRGGPRDASSQFYVDPVSGAMLGNFMAARPPILAFAHQLHGNFLMGRDGRRFVGWLGLAMVILGFSGLVLWWPRNGQWKSGFIVRRGAKGLRLHRELHGMVGIWAYLIFIAVSFSGVALAWPQLVGMPNLGAGARTVPLVAPLAGARPIGADTAVALVEARAPGMVLRNVTVPQLRAMEQGQPITVSFLSHGAISATATVDPLRAKLLDIRDPSADFLAWMRPLHQGTLGSLWRFLVFLCGLLPSLFVVTGVAMWWKKRVNRRAVQAKLVPQPAE